MAKEITGPQAQLNLSVVALVALVAIVGLVALVLNSAGFASPAAVYSEPQLEQAAPVENMVGQGMHGIRPGLSWETPDRDLYDS